jgi:hypothetical protein
MKENILPRFKSIIPNWACHLKDHKASFVLSLIYIVFVLVVFINFLRIVEQRDGFTLTDPILKTFSPIDLTWLTFSLIYGLLFIAVLHLIDKPQLFHTALMTYAIMVSFRIVAMYSLPLNPPETMIVLNDPFVQLFGSTEVLTKDLFFSGHTATLFILYLVSRQKLMKTIFLLCAILVGVCVLLQHVHYTVDVLAAPFFVFASYSISLRLIVHRW